MSLPSQWGRGGWWDARSEICIRFFFSFSCSCSSSLLVCPQPKPVRCCLGCFNSLSHLRQQGSGNLLVESNSSSSSSSASLEPERRQREPPSSPSSPSSPSQQQQQQQQLLGSRQQSLMDKSRLLENRDVSDRDEIYDHHFALSIVFDETFFSLSCSFHSSSWTDGTTEFGFGTAGRR